MLLHLNLWLKLQCLQVFSTDRTLHEHNPLVVIRVLLPLQLLIHPLQLLPLLFLSLNCLSLLPLLFLLLLLLQLDLYTLPMHFLWLTW